MYPVVDIVHCALNTNQNFEPHNVKESRFTDEDPLDGLGDVSEEIFYKLEKNVFADPIKLADSDMDNGDNTGTKFTFLDKVTVEKRVGKRNKYHIELDDASKPVCPEVHCNKRFSSVTLLRAHVRKVHCAVKNHICELCGSGFAAQYLLTRHMAVHEKSVTQCPLCGAHLSKRTSMSVHRRFVHRQGTLSCDKCDRRFERRSDYVRHRSSHKTAVFED